LNDFEQLSASKNINDFKENLICIGFDFGKVPEH